MDEAQALADRIAVLVGREDRRQWNAGRARRPQRAAGHRAVPPPDGASCRGVAGAIVGRDGAHLTITAADAARTAHAVTRWAPERDLVLRDFTVTRPSLEDIYLRLTEEAPR